MSAVSSRACPRCKELLKASRYHEVQIDLCLSCNGVLVQQPDLVRLLQQVVADIEAEVDFSSPIEEQSDSGGTISCPQCQQEMQNYSYMGVKQVQIDSCSRCRLLWFDADELGAASVIYARSQKRSDEMRQQSKEYGESLSRTTMNTLVARAFRRAFIR